MAALRGDERCPGRTCRALSPPGGRVPMEDYGQDFTMMGPRNGNYRYGRLRRGLRGPGFVNGRLHRAMIDWILDRATLNGMRS